MGIRLPKADLLFRQFNLWLVLGLAGLIGLRLFLDRDGPNVLLPTAGLSAPAFRLTERSGGTVALEDLRGSVWVADFIFTRCKGPCPFLSQQMARLQTRFAKAPNFRLVSFSVDPVFDTPAVLRTYAERFRADPERWFFLTGDAAAVHDIVVQGFRVAVEGAERPKSSDPLLHSVRLVLVDREGRLRGGYDGTKSKDMKRLDRDIRVLL
ncbi:MAG: SCO family protein [Elusimicrobia bacterium]|nr:SCO family protein [Elusimicrobiota bacterium]